MNSPFLRVFLAAVILSCAASVGNGARLPRASAEGQSPATVMAQKIAVDGIPNFGEVTPTLYRGAQPSDSGLRKLKEMNFDIVVDFRTGHASERQKVISLGMEYVTIPWNCDHPQDKDIALFISLIRSHPGKKIFIHCLDGIDRTGMETAAFRMIEQGWSTRDARKEMELFGFSHYHRAICIALVPYESNFRSRFQTNPAFESLRAPSPAATDPRTK
jgi:Tyrosine phosphatase family